MKLSFIKAFTLAEALITLGIIGVISTITIPNLISTYRVKIIESRLKSTFSILSQSIKLAEAEHEECTGWDQVYSGATYVYPFMKNTFFLLSNTQMKVLAQIYRALLIITLPHIFN